LFIVVIKFGQVALSTLKESCRPLSGQPFYVHPMDEKIYPGPNNYEMFAIYTKVAQCVWNASWPAMSSGAYSQSGLQMLLIQSAPEHCSMSASLSCVLYQLIRHAINPISGFHDRIGGSTE